MYGTEVLNASICLGIPKQICLPQITSYQRNKYVRKYSHESRQSVYALQRSNQTSVVLFLCYAVQRLPVDNITKSIIEEPSRAFISD